jgi:hypothetical protein
MTKLWYPLIELFLLQDRLLLYFGFSLATAETLNLNSVVFPCPIFLVQHVLTVHTLARSPQKGPPCSDTQLSAVCRLRRDSVKREPILIGGFVFFNTVNHKLIIILPS